MHIGDLITSLSKLATSIIANFPLLIVGLIGIGFLIGFHELGHFLFCKLFGISTPSFSIGFGPQLFSRKIGDTNFSLSLLPMGGYVEVAGMQEVGQGEQKEAQRADKRSFRSKPYYQKMLVLGGGILFNLLFAYIALILLFMAGIPKTPLLFPYNSTTTIKQVTEHGAAQKAQLTAGDTIQSINGTPVHNVQDLISLIEPHADKEVQVEFERDHTKHTLPVTLGSRTVGKHAVGTLGVEFELHDIQPHSFMDAVKQGIRSTNQIIKNTFLVFKNMFARKNINGLGGPIMVITQTIAGASKGVKIFMLLLAVISINLAVINLVPLPVFDGGQALFYTIEAVLGRSLADSTREIIHYITWIGLLALMLYLTFKDTIHLCNAFWK